MSSLNIAGFAEGLMYPKLSPSIAALQTAGWTSFILGLFHLSSAGEISFNDKLIITGGKYTGSAGWVKELAQLMQPGAGNTITKLLASFGGGGVGDFGNIQTIYQNNGNSLAGTPLEKNFQAFRTTFPMITLIDMDVEDSYNQPSFTAFCQMLAKLGFGITFCPYDDLHMSFWTGSLLALNQSHPGVVKWWNLQCYDGGGSNDPQDWARAIAKAVPGFTTASFILASDWSRFLNKPDPNDKSTWYWDGDCPSVLQTHLSKFKGEPCVGGAFIWTIDSIVNYAADEKILPDPQSCHKVGMSDYVAAILAAL